MFCKNCGTNTENSNFCPNCGTPVEVSPPKIFCSNCGTDVSGSKFCPNCGSAVNNAAYNQGANPYNASPYNATPYNANPYNATPNNASPYAGNPYSYGAAPIVEKPRKKCTRSLSFIFFTIFGFSLIGMIFIPFFGTCSHYETYYGKIYDSYYSSETLFHFSDYGANALWAIMLIVLFAIPIILSFINFFTRTKALAIINTVFTSTSFIYLIIISFILTDDHFAYSSNSYSWDFGYTFGDFDVGFYVMLVISLFLCIVSIFDTMNKPIIKTSK